MTVDHISTVIKCQAAIATLKTLQNQNTYLPCWLWRIELAAGWNGWPGSRPGVSAGRCQMPASSPSCPACWSKQPLHFASGKAPEICLQISLFHNVGGNLHLAGRRTAEECVLGLPVFSSPTWSLIPPRLVPDSGCRFSHIWIQELTNLTQL